MPTNRAELFRLERSSCRPHCFALAGQRRRLRGSVCWLTALSVFGPGCAETTLGGPEQQHPTLVTPHHIAEGDTGKPESVSSTSSADPSVEPPPPEPATHGDLPDPEPLEAKEQVRYELRFQRGELLVERVERVRLKTPRRTVRQMGRFAVELWIGDELLERARFDFPLLGAPAPENPPHTYGPPIDFEAGLDVSREVWLPFLERATRAQVVDRARRSVVVLPWPPDTAEPVVAADGPKTAE